ncbi:MAG: hypothetical protein ABI583_01770 [Betaproteobacteria bacterium]
MNKQRDPVFTSVLLMFAGLVLWVLTGVTLAEAAPSTINAYDAGSASALRVRHEDLHDRLANNIFQRPLVLESTQTSRDVKGDVYAVVPHAFSIVGEALAGSQSWCDILILHLNTKYCKTAQTAGGTELIMNVGKKFDQPLADSFRLTFAWKLANRQPDYMRVLLRADEGPLGTHDYRITLEATPLENGQTFVHLSYAYGFGMTGNLAMLAYFNTIGRDKVGFTVTGVDKDGQPEYVDGMRGLVERNTMRYHLAVESYLGALSLKPSAQFEKRIKDWFLAVEQYPRQLHEMDQSQYLDMKRKENLRQQAG